MEQEEGRKKGLRGSKVFKFKDGDQILLQVTINEIYEADYSLFVWPSAPVLAQFVWFNRSLFARKQVLEIGSGTGLVGLVAAKVGANVILSDSFPDDKSLELCTSNIRDNGLSSKEITALTLKWGLFTKELFSLPTLDIIVASDCFYDQCDFEDILVTVSFLLRNKCRPDACFYTSYQIRHSEWNISCMLERYGLTGSLIDLNQFESDGHELLATNLPGNHTIELWKFQLVH